MREKKSFKETKRSFSFQASDCVGNFDYLSDNFSNLDILSAAIYVKVKHRDSSDCSPQSLETGPFCAVYPLPVSLNSSNPLLKDAFVEVDDFISKAVEELGIGSLVCSVVYDQVKNCIISTLAYCRRYFGTKVMERKTLFPNHQGLLRWYFEYSIIFRLTILGFWCQSSFHLEDLHQLDVVSIKRCCTCLLRWSNYKILP